jgi:hypothetical protein
MNESIDEKCKGKGGLEEMQSIQFPTAETWLNVPHPIFRLYTVEILS